MARMHLIELEDESWFPAVLRESMTDFLSFVENLSDKPFRDFTHKLKGAMQATGDSTIAPLDHQTIHPYTDLLLHDMGPALADGQQDFAASGSEWRTQPLWGLGLQKVVNGHTRLLHDGRARDVSEAILWHGGEGERAKEAFRNLSQQDREALLKFIDSL